MVEGAPGLSGASFVMALIPFTRALPSWPSCLPKAPSPSTITLGISVPTGEISGGRKHSDRSKGWHLPASKWWGSVVERTGWLGALQGEWLRSIWQLTLALISHVRHMGTYLIVSIVNFGPPNYKSNFCIQYLYIIYTDLHPNLWILYN